jgi:hypothetical protein
MIELILAILYIIFGISLFKFDIEHNISGRLYAGCFDDKGFELYLIFYIIMSPLIVGIIIYNQIKKLLKFLCQ